MASTLSTDPIVLIFGASTAAGRFFLQRASGLSGLGLIAVSRKAPDKTCKDVTWLQHDLDEAAVPVSPAVLVSFGPVGLAAKQLTASASIGRVVALSSASTLFKSDSEDERERSLMQSIAADERRLIQLCKIRNAALNLFKTTMIYGGGRDANISRLGELIKRLPVTPVTGKGLRAPVHADDLAKLVLSVLPDGEPDQRTWLLEGGERLTYPELLRRTAAAAGVSTRIIRLPPGPLRLALALAHRLGRLGDVNAAMLTRQADDLVVDDCPAREQLGWNPRVFSP